MRALSSPILLFLAIISILAFPPYVLLFAPKFCLTSAAPRINFGLRGSQKAHSQISLFDISILIPPETPADGSPACIDQVWAHIQVEVSWLPTWSCFTAWAMSARIWRISRFVALESANCRWWSISCLRSHGRLQTVKSVMMMLRDSLWLSREDMSSPPLKKASTLFCLEALSRS